MEPNSATNRSRSSLVSVVLPVFNEASILRTLQSRIDAGMARAGCRWEVIYVNDGSTDGSGEILTQLANERSNIRCVHLSRNFGHQSAIHAGLAHSRGDSTIIMDSDLQDDPDRLGDFVRAWREGADVVYAIREKRKESWWKQVLFSSFYRVLNRISDTPIPLDAGAFGLMDRRVVQEILRLGEVERFLPGLRSWVGFRQKGIVVERCARHDDKPRVSLRQLFKLAQSAIFGFSRFPLFIFYAISMVSLAVSVGCLSYALISKWHTGLAIPGWASTVVLASLFGGLNALGIAVLGEYVIRIHQQVLGRPSYIVDRIDSRSISTAPEAKPFANVEYDSVDSVMEVIDGIRQSIHELHRAAAERSSVSG
ncbi:MAG: glycosyltransferase family 2 protein [Planctomycetota bacterium]|jgi:glycosyltransferase involved in cell wall biosynthesis